MVCDSCGDKTKYLLNRNNECKPVCNTEKLNAVDCSAPNVPKRCKPGYLMDNGACII